MPQRQFLGPKLPKELRDRFGDPANQKKKGGGRNVPLNRKERRKAERKDKRTHKTQGRAHNDVRHARREPESIVEEDEDNFSDEASSVSTPAFKQEPPKPLKSILKKPSIFENPGSDNEPTPASSPVISRAVKDRLAQDDAEIAALEKKLGIRGRKRKETDSDGLDDLFGDLGGEVDSDDALSSERPSKRKRTEDDEWLARKRKRALGGDAHGLIEDEIEGDKVDETSSDEDEDIEGEDFSSDEDMADEPTEEGGFDEGSLDDSDSEDFESEPKNEDAPVKSRTRENPYLPPVAPGVTATSKYIPPSMRAPPSSDAEALTRLKRQIQGLLNRLSDANMLTILRDIEHIYQSNARGYVTTTVIDLLMGLLADESTLPDTFLILHAGFIASIYKVIGPDFGAQMIERIVTEFDQHYKQNKIGIGKHATNLMSLIAELYMFQVIGSNMVFDYIKLFLDDLSEINTELLLRIVKVSGSQLRQDDPTSLKDIVLLLQTAVTNIGESNLPVRTRFMIETINNLKSNRMKTGIGASAIVSEHTTRMKKQLGTLNTRNLKGTEPLRMNLGDIKDTEKRGKWWLVGASWRNDTGDPGQDKDSTTSSKQTRNSSSRDLEDEEVDLLQLAKEQRMNTDIRRAIFIAIMSATDFKDAYVRLLKLNLKRSQEAEIPRVIVHCAGCEASYNPYYTLLARKFCSDHKSRKGFQFALWDVFKSLGEKRDEDDVSADEDESNSEATSLRRLVNLGKLYGALIANEGLPITTLKPLNFPYLQPKTKTFLEIMLVTIILQSQRGLKDGRNEKALLNIFIRVDAAPEMITGLQFFLKKVVSKSVIAANTGEKDTLKWACKTVVGMLVRLMATTTVAED